MAYFFDEHYQERVTLKDGTPVELRLIRPEDKDMLQRALTHLSEQSRYQRFFTAKPHLNDRELKFLTEVDGYNHFAIAAALAEPTNPEDRGLGIVRFVRYANEPHVAEPAITVIDPMQGKGLGRILFIRSVAAARERDITHFRCEVMAGNAGARALIRDIAPNAATTNLGSETRIEFALPKFDMASLTTESHKGPLYNLFSGVAAGELAIRHTLRSIKNVIRHNLS